MPCNAHVRACGVCRAGSTIDSMHVPTYSYGLVEVWESSTVFEDVTVSNIAQDVSQSEWRPVNAEGPAGAEGPVPGGGTTFTFAEAEEPIAAVPPVSSSAYAPYAPESASVPDHDYISYDAYGPAAANASYSSLDDVPQYGLFDAFGQASIVVLVRPSRLPALISLSSCNNSSSQKGRASCMSLHSMCRWHLSGRTGATCTGLSPASGPSQREARCALHSALRSSLCRRAGDSCWLGKAMAVEFVLVRCAFILHCTPHHESSRRTLV